MITIDRHKIRRRPVSTSGPSTSSSLFRRTDANPKPLADKDFVLDIENPRMLQEMTVDIEKLGGRVVDMVNEEKPPFCVVSDCAHMERIQKMKKEQLTPQMLKCLPMLVRDAIRIGVRYRACKAFLESLDNLKHKVRAQKKIVQAPVKKSSSGMTILQSPYLKLEDERGAFAPVFKQFTPQSNCRMVYLGKYTGKSLFHKNNHPDSPKKEKSPNEKQKLAMLPKHGFCEICNKKYMNNKEHFASHEHQMSISQPGLYSSVDELCGSFLDYVSGPHTKHRQRLRPTPSSPNSITR